MLNLGLHEDTSSLAADTGSAVHKAVECFHRDPSKSVQAALDAMAALKVEKYPQADLGEAERHFRPYAQDFLNSGAEVTHTEQAVGFTLPPHPSDPTGREIVVSGTLDQLRLESGLYWVCDLKTSKLYGQALLQLHAYQLAGYMLGAFYTLKLPIHGAKIIRTRDYLMTTRGPAIWASCLTMADASALMEQVSYKVAQVRAGRPHINPGMHCQWCPEGGVQNCVGTLSKQQNR